MLNSRSNGHGPTTNRGESTVLVVSVMAAVGLAGVLAVSVVTLMPQRPIANSKMGIAEHVNYEVLDRSASIADLERGRSYYGQLCLGCHGASGQGNGEWAYRLTPRPADLTGDRVARREDRALLSAISNGIEGSAMKGWKDRLSVPQRTQVLLYIRHLRQIRQARKAA